MAVMLPSVTDARPSLPCSVPSVSVASCMRSGIAV